MTALFTYFLIVIIFCASGISTANAQTRDITFPVEGPSSFRDDFGDPRAGGTREHLGVDIIADKMTPVVSAVDGEVNYAIYPEPSWGYSVSIEDGDGYTYRYLHLNNDNIGTDDGDGGRENAYVGNLRRGDRVKKGEHISWVGDSGNAENTISHLHFEIRKPGGSAINPYPSLVSAAEASPFSSSIRVNTGMTTNHTAVADVPLDVADPTYYFTQDLTVGMRSEAVRQLQLRLKALGYFTSYITDYFGPITKSAVINFQTTNNIAATGVVSSSTRALLNYGLTPPPVTAPIATSVFILTKNLSSGASGEEVRQLQLRLQHFGFFRNITATGYFGTLTRGEVIKFQTAKGIAPTGGVELITRGYLNGCVAPSGYSTLTGVSCANLLLPGCASNSGYSLTTGRSCGTTYLPGCTSTSGYSTINGKACWNI